jgi:hypothetical protein
MNIDGITHAGAEGVYSMQFSPDDEYYMALYTDAARLDENTASYIATGEAKGAGYTAGGRRLGPPKMVKDGKCVVWDWDDPVWENSSIDACCALIWNKTRNASLAVLSFEPKTSRNGRFRVAFPPPTSQQGVVRFYF